MVLGVGKKSEIRLKSENFDPCDGKGFIELKYKMNNTSELEDRVEILELEVSFLQTALDGVAGDVDDVEADQTSQDNRMNNIEGNINELEDEVNSLEAAYVNLLMRVDTTEEDIILLGEQMNVLENQVDLFEDEMNLFDGRVAQLENYNEENTERLDDLEDLTNITNTKLETLEDVVANLEANIATLDNNVTLIVDELSAIQLNVGENKMAITELEDMLSALETKVGTETIAFHAHLSDTAAVPGKVVVYGTIVVNAGNCYNSSSGVFTVPKHGIYLFSMKVRNLRSGTDHDQYYMRKNGANIGMALTDGETSTGAYVDTTCTSIVEAQAGDEIHVYADGNADIPFSGTVSTYFSGMLVRGITI